MCTEPPSLWGSQHLLVVFAGVLLPQEQLVLVTGTDQLTVSLHHQGTAMRKCSPTKEGLVLLLMSCMEPTTREMV